jgi:acyl-CoA synthetase (AMP-forming)/AMP-acid ligase II
MTVKSARLVYVCEYLLALVAIFTAWSEIGGHAVLDVMPWFWKFGLGAALAAAIVAYTAVIGSEDSLWTLRSARWLTAVVLLLLAVGVVTYYYVLEEDTVGPDDAGAASLFLRVGPALFQLS